MIIFESRSPVRCSEEGLQSTGQVHKSVAHQEKHTEIEKSNTSYCLFNKDENFQRYAVREKKIFREGEKERGRERERERERKREEGRERERVRERLGVLRSVCSAQARFTNP